MFNKTNYHRWLFLFIAVHTFFWTLVPIMVRNTLPMDAVEGALWGQHFALGYDKNPWMNAWLTDLAIKTGGTSGWMTYLFCQLSVAICFWTVWRLGRKFLSPVHALAAVFLLEFFQCFNINAIDFNDNVLELGLWGLITLSFYNALKTKKMTQWLWVGLFSGLALMTKYYVVILFIPMIIVFFLSKENFENFKRPGIYLAGLVFLLIVLPHFIWLFYHHFITADYAFRRVGNPQTFLSHILPAANFLWNAFLKFLPVLLVFSMVFIGRRGEEILTTKKTIERSDRRFLLLMGIGPLAVNLLISIITGSKLHAGWQAPLFFLWTIILVSWKQPIITRRRFHRLVIIVAFGFTMLLTGYIFSLTQKGCTSGANYPGEKIANTLTAFWKQNYKLPLRYVVGDRFEAGVVSLYSKDHPSVYIDSNPVISFWMNEKDLLKHGGLFIWDKPEAYKNDIYKRYVFSKIKKFTFHWLRGDGRKGPIVLYVGLMKPRTVMPV